MAAFYYAARAGSIQTAARELGLNRNSLSRYLDELERAGGVRLRDPAADVRGIALTEAGRHLAALLEPLFTRLETVAAQFAGGLQELRLGCQSSTSCYLLPGWIQAFGEERRRAHPDEPEVPRFSLKTGSSEEILGALRGLEVDVGIVADDASRGYVEGGLRFYPLFREALLAVCPRDHPFAHTGPVAAEQFVGHPQYLYYRGGERYQERINALAPGEGASRQMEFDTIAAIKETIRAGLGISILPGGALRAEDLASMAIVRLATPPDRAHRLIRVIAAVTRAGEDLTPLARSWLQFLQEHQKQLLHPPP